MVRQRMSGKGLVVCLSGLLLGIAEAPASAGVVTLDSQTRSVSMGTPQSAMDFGPFNGSSSSGDFGVSQTSSLTVSSTGAVIVDHSSLHGPITESPAAGSSIFEVQFTLSEAAPFTLSYDGLYGDARNLPAGGTIVNGSFTGPGAPGTLAPSNPPLYIPGTPLTYSGTLQPGTFNVKADLEAQANTGNVDLTLNIVPAIGTSAVPLPPAIWTALATLPLLGLAVRYVRRSAFKQC